MIDSQAIHSIAKSMREFGIAHFKMGDLEMRLEGAPFISEAASSPIIEELEKTAQPHVWSKPKEPLSPEDEEIKHKVEEFKSVMSIGDEQLVDRLFPDFTKPEESED